MGLDYGSFDHRHRFAAWAAARATQPAFASVGVLRDALETSGLVEFVRDPVSLDSDAAAFEAHHRSWCRRILDSLAEKGIANGTYGRAAKLVAVYLKSIRRRGPWRSLEAVGFATLEWVGWFNTKRLLEPIGYVPPAEYEARYYQQAAVA